MKPEHREFFVELRKLCAKHSASILLSSKGDFMVCRFEQYTSNDKTYKLTGVIPDRPVFVYPDAMEVIECEEPKP